MSATLDRQLRPIYGNGHVSTLLVCNLLTLHSISYSRMSDAIDTGSNKSAIVACNKLLKKQPKNDLVKVCSTMRNHTRLVT